MIELRKAHAVAISESQKQDWIREMYKALRESGEETASMRSGDTMIRIRISGRIISIDEFRAHREIDLTIEDFENKLAEK